MAAIQWDAKYSVGVAEFDDQHKKLIAIINELDEAMRSGKGKDVIGKVVHGLVEYTVTHFAAEEKKMSAMKYPGYLAQKGEHDKFVTKIKQFEADMKSGKIAMSVEVMAFLKDWLINHISGTDKKYTAFFNAAGVK